MCHCPVLELSRWRLFSPEVPSVVTVMAAVMSPGGSNHGPESWMDQTKGRNNSGVFLDGEFHDREKVSINFPSLDIVIRAFL